MISETFIQLAIVIGIFVLIIIIGYLEALKRKRE